MVIKCFPQCLQICTALWCPVVKVMKASMILGFRPVAAAVSSGSLPGSLRKNRRQCSTRFNLLVRLIVNIL